MTEGKRNWLKVLSRVDVLTALENYVREEFEPPLEEEGEKLLFEFHSRDTETMPIVIASIGVIDKDVPAEEDPDYVCALCGSANVEHAFWANPNTDEVTEPFGTWNQPGSAYCHGCDRGTDEGVRLISYTEYRGTLYSVDVGICWTHMSWEVFNTKVRARTEKEAEELALKKAEQWVDDHAPSGAEVANYFIYSWDPVYENEEEAT